MSSNVPLVVSKSILTSKTFWASVIKTTSGVLAVFLAQDYIQANPGTVSLLITAAGILEVLLRAVTSQPVTVPFISE